MTNFERLQMEIPNISSLDAQASIYLQENGLDPNTTYNPDSKTNLKQIYKAALNVLESIANDPAGMKNYKQDDTSVSAFAENLQARIDQLSRKIRQLPDDDNTYSDGGSVIYIFNR